MKDTETYHDFLKRMDAKVQSVTLHYADDNVTVSGATLQTCYHDSCTWRRGSTCTWRHGSTCTWRRGSTLLEEIAADDVKRFNLVQG